MGKFQPPEIPTTKINMIKFYPREIITTKTSMINSQPTELPKTKQNIKEVEFTNALMQWGEGKWASLLNKI